ncbi:MAG: outer membrane protein assembly factor BamA, partial [Acinetobacter sp.]|nr:outer membrane protein assembly factor BamA [Acinetobacter sp.]
IPFYRNFFGGGFGSVRGFRDFSMGPVSIAQSIDPVTGERVDVPGVRRESVGGNVQIEAGAEIIFPTPFIDSNKVRTLAFFDVGNIFETNGVSKFKPDVNNLRYSVGLGLSWITPIGPLTFAIAAPLNTAEDDDTQVFQFSLGQGF